MYLYNLNNLKILNIILLKSNIMRAFRLLKKLMPSSGGGDDFEKAKKSIRLARYGCANRPFYHIVVVLVSIIILNSKYFVYNIKTFVF